IVGQNEQHIGRAFGRDHARRPPRLRLRRVRLDHAAEFRIGWRKLIARDGRRRVRRTKCPGCLLSVGRNSRYNKRRAQRRGPSNREFLTFHSYFFLLFCCVSFIRSFPGSRDDLVRFVALLLRIAIGLWGSMASPDRRPFVQKFLRTLPFQVWPPSSEPELPPGVLVLANVRHSHLHSANVTAKRLGSIG